MRLQFLTLAALAALAAGGAAQAQPASSVQSFVDRVQGEANARLAERAAQFGAGLITTEKDWVRLPKSWRTRIAAWPVRARFDDPAGLDALLSRAGL